MSRRLKPDMIEIWDILGDFRGWAWKQNNAYTSYLFYVEPWGSC